MADNSSVSTLTFPHQDLESINGYASAPPHNEKVLSDKDAPNTGSPPSFPAMSVPRTGLPTVIPSTTANSPSLTHSATSTSFSANGSIPKGAAVGLTLGAVAAAVLVTFLVTVFFLRRKTKSWSGENNVRHKRRNIYADEGEDSGMTANNLQLSSNLRLPGAADNALIINKTRTCLDQIELYIENYYQNERNHETELHPKALGMFEIPNLPKPLASHIQTAQDTRAIIKYALSYTVITSVSYTVSNHWPLLPEDFLLLPRLTGGDTYANENKPGMFLSCPDVCPLEAFLTRF